MRDGFASHWADVDHCTCVVVVAVGCASPPVNRDVEPPAQPSRRSALPDSFDVTVAADGSGNFRTIQEAINAVRDYTPIPRAIFVRNGVYREKLLIPEWKTGITIVGESVERTIIEWDDHAGKGPINTFTSYTARVSGNDIHIHNITFVNSAGPVGQALALFVDGDRVLFEHCRFIGNQDTIFAAGEDRAILSRRVRRGHDGFHLRPGTAYFENCEVRSKARSYITAASTPSESLTGSYSIGAGSRRTRRSTALSWTSVARSRPDGVPSDGDGAHIIAAGWHNWGRPDADARATTPSSRALGRARLALASLGRTPYGRRTRRSTRATRCCAAVRAAIPRGSRLPLAVDDYPAPRIRSCSVVVVRSSSWITGNQETPCAAHRSGRLPETRRGVVRRTGWSPRP